MTTTRKSLLRRVRDAGDSAAWEQFFALYAPLLESFARASGLSPSDAEDVRDQCLAVIAQRMPTFEYERANGTFKGWLYRLARGKVVDLLRRPRAEQPATAELLAVPSSSGDPDEAWERRWREEHLRYALEVARRAESDAGRVALELTLAGRPLPEICASTGLNPNQVYKVKARMLKRVRAELAKLGVEL